MNDLTLYEKFQYQIDTGDLIEFGASSFIGWSIRKFTGRDVNHTATVIRYKTSTLSGGEGIPRRYIFEAITGGYLPTFLSLSLKKYKGKVYWLPLKEQYNAFRLPISVVAHSFLGVPYDFESLFKNATGAVSSDIRKLFCSEAADEELRQSGLLDIDYNNGKRLRPGEFAATGLYEDRVKIL